MFFMETEKGQDYEDKINNLRVKIDQMQTQYNNEVSSLQ